jgi:hypothetical protein
MGRKATNLIGRRFGRLEVIGQAVTARYSRWRCRCDCGAIIVVTCNLLNNGDTKSCGCLHRDQVRANLKRLHTEKRAGPAKQYGRQQQSEPQHDAGPLARALGY